MKFDEYQELAYVTANKNLTFNEALCNWSMGLSGEAGEFIELLKKQIFHSKQANRDQLVKELGDILWYLANAALCLGISLQEIADTNIAKLKARYPEGFVDWHSRTDKEK